MEYMLIVQKKDIVMLSTLSSEKFQWPCECHLRLRNHFVLLQNTYPAQGLINIMVQNVTLYIALYFYWSAVRKLYKELKTRGKQRKITGGITLIRQSDMAKYQVKKLDSIYCIAF